MKPAAGTNRRYYYLVSVSFTLGARAGSGSEQLTWDEPINTIEHVEAIKKAMGDHLGRLYPTWDKEYRGWRDSVTVLAFSLLRIEVLQRGRWVLADWQPWGPLNPT